MSVGRYSLALASMSGGISFQGLGKTRLRRQPASTILLDMHNMRRWSDSYFTVSTNKTSTLEAWCCGSPLHHAFLSQNDTSTYHRNIQAFGPTPTGSSLIVPGFPVMICLQIHYRVPCFVETVIRTFCPWCPSARFCDLAHLYPRYSHIEDPTVQ